MYRALCDFVDLMDGRHFYHAGDVYPRQGYAPSADRLSDLRSGSNKAKMALIEEIPDAETKPAKNGSKGAQRTPRKRRSK